MNQTKIPSIRPTTIHNLVDFFPLFAKGSWPLSNRLDKIRSANYFGESYFQWIFRLDRLKIGFPCSNLSTNPPVSGFGGEDSPPTIIGIGSAGMGGSVDGSGWTPLIVGWLAVILGISLLLPFMVMGIVAYSMLEPSRWLKVNLH